MSKAARTTPVPHRALRIGVLSPATSGFFFGEILAGVVREAGRLGVRVALVQTVDAGLTGDVSPGMVNGTHPVAWHHLDGFVVSAWASTDDYLRRLHAVGKPLALACTSVGDVDACAVVVDNESGIRMSVDHLIAHGHNRIVYAGRIQQSDITERYAAYTAYLPECGLTPLPLIEIASDIEPGGRAAADAIVALPPERRPTAALAATDRVAIGLIAGLQEHGVRVPQDIAVIGFDDVPAGWYSTPQLTTVRQRFEEVGAAATAVLLAELSGGAHRSGRISVPTTLVCRQSCGCDASVIEPSEAVAYAAQTLVGELERRVASAPASTASTASATGPRGTQHVGQHVGQYVGQHFGQHNHPQGSIADVAAHAATVRDLDAAVSSALDRFLSTTPPPEDIDGFAYTALELLSTAPADADPESTELRHYAMGRIASTLTRLRAAQDARRVARLSVALRRQLDVGMGLLGEPEGDPTSLAWLDRVGVTAGCLALWTAEPGSPLVITGVHAPGNLLDATLGTTVAIEDFPPPALLDLADAATGHVAYLIPVRGTTGDHGMLCLVAQADAEFSRDRATFDHWAAFLGAALREKSLLAEIRHSEERYATAARAANDGLWEWDAATRRVYLSDRCADLLALPHGVDVTVEDTLGRVDPEDFVEVEQALSRAIAEPEIPVEVVGRVIHPDGSVRWVRVRAIGIGADPAGPGVGVGVGAGNGAGNVGNAVGSHGVVGSLSDIDDFKRLENQLRQAALFDPVTGLPNRRLFLDRLERAMTQPTRRSGSRFAVLFLDLDGFKLINDSLGHLAGDELLRIVGTRLNEQVRSVDTAARFGGDEFALLMTDPVPDDLLVVARRIQARIADPVLLGDQEVSVTASVGIAASHTTYADAEEVLRDADIAMYRAKESERGTACVFDPAMHLRAMDRLRTRSTITAALAANQFVVHYQPIVDLDGGALTQFEALIRWQHPERGLLLPGEFLPAMEGNSAIVTLGRQVLEQVCTQIAAWRADADVPVRVSVNVSHREFWNPELLSSIRATLERHRVPPQCVVLEITESVIMSDLSAAQEIMAGLHAAGLQLHVDDFGTGHSSLHALRTFPVDALKIDGSFIRDLGPDQPTALVRAIVAMGAALGLEVVAECVETPEQADQLRAMGCTTAQGWLYSRAVPADDAGALLGRQLATELPE